MRVVLVAYGDVIEHVLLPFEHAPGAVVHDGRELVAEARIEGAAVRHRRGGEMRRAVLVLQALARQRGAAGGAADEEAARARNGRRPDQVSDPLETEDRVVDGERLHRDA